MANDRTRLSPRDLLVLEWIGDVRGVPWSTLGWLLARESSPPRVEPLSERGVRKWVRRMEAVDGVGLVRSASIGGSMWVQLTRHGAGRFHVPWNRYGLNLSELGHFQAVGEVRLYLEAVLSGEGEWVPEAAFRRSRPGEVAPYRRPDAGWRTGEGLVAIEVELHRKTTFRGQYVDLVASLAPEVDEVWWFTASDSETAWLRRKLEGAPLPCRLQVVPYLELPGLHPEGCVCMACRRAGRSRGLEAVS